MSKLKNLFLASVLSFAGLPLMAQSCDPWIVSIYKQTYNRQPTAEECNIRNYNNGSWSSYTQLTELIKKYQSSRSTQATPAGDPWIIAIYKSLYGRSPNAAELKISNYNNGSWSSYEQLTQLIKNYQASLHPSVSAPAIAGDPWIIKIYKEEYNRTPNSTELRISNYNNGRWNSYEELKGYIVQYQNVLKNNAAGRRNPDPRRDNPANPGGNVIAPGGGNVIAPGGGNVIAPGGGNVIAPGGGNVIAPGGGNVIAPGGGNVIAPGGGNVIAPGGGNVIAPGGGNVVSPGGGN